MATTLEVVNDCLATMGETPLNTLTEPHEFKASAQRALSRANKSIQAVGWWCNLEAATYVPGPNGQIQLPGDALKWQSGTRSSDKLLRSVAKPWIIQRGNRLYDTREGSYQITEEVTGELVRLVPFEELPLVLNEFIAAQAVLRFQSNFDADNSKRAELTENWKVARIDARAEQIRQAAVNFRHSNSTLSRIKSVTNAARRYIGR